jgi:hypothetical protein
MTTDIFESRDMRPSAQLPVKAIKKILEDL